MTVEWIGSQETFSSFDGIRIHYRHISPRKPTCFSVLLIHGLREHAGRYNNLYNYMAPMGYEIFAPDLRGHGMSEGQRGHIYSFDEHLKDIEILGRKMEAAKPQKCDLGGSDILMGHSMGGLIALRYALDHQDEFRALVVTGPALEISVPIPGWKKAMGNLFSKLLPKFSMPNGLDPDGLSRSEDVVKAYLDDPLVHDRVSARFFTEFVGAMDYVHANAHKFEIPILIMHGSDDRLTGVGGSRRFIEKCGSEDKELKVYEGAYHELYNEINHIEVLNHLEAWLKKRDL